MNYARRSKIIAIVAYAVVACWALSSLALAYYYHDTVGVVIYAALTAFPMWLVLGSGIEADIDSKARRLTK